MYTANQNEIILTLLQGGAAVKWADGQVGWEPNSTVPGTLAVVGVYRLHYGRPLLTRVPYSV